MPRTHRRFVETDGLAVAGGDHHLGVAAGELGLDQLVALADDDGVHAVLARTRVGLQFGLLDRAVLGAHDDVVVVHVLRIGQALDVDVSADLVVRLDLDDVLDGAALRRP